MSNDILKKAAAQARGLAIDAVHACSSGHLGLPLGCAEIGAVLFSSVLRINPAEPRWLNRDRFVLSAGHGSMFLYSWLHLAGFDVSLQDLKDFRKADSKTPGHPEFMHTVGVECTTGPLGQGVANAVGFAISAKRAAAVYNTPQYTIFDQHVICLAGDGCLQEGISREAAALAGHLKLDNLILIHDSNDVTLDAMADMTQDDDMEALFKAMDWDVFKVDGHDIEAVSAILEQAKALNNGKPTMIIAKTQIARGIPEVAGTPKGHGEGGAKFWKEAHAGLGLPVDEQFYVSDDVLAYFADRRQKHADVYAAWVKTYEAWRTEHPTLAAELDAGREACAKGLCPKVLSSKIAPFSPDFEDATRSSSGEVLNQIADAEPFVLTGSADLYGSTKNYLKGKGDFTPDNYLSRNFWFGVREHAMGAVCNGIAYDGLFRISCATFLVFVDYMRASVRVAALSKLPVTYILTHDSVAVGEDGPTHQPVETVSGLRVIPNLDVIRPADPEETVGAYLAAMERADGPTALILTRQKVKTLNDIPVETRRKGVLKGAYIARRETTPLEAIILSCGSELELALEAAEQAGAGVRVVSMPSMYRFDKQSREYKEEILPPSCTRRVSVEAGVDSPWWKYVGSEGRTVSIDNYGFSAPGDYVLKKLGMNVENVLQVLSETKNA